MIERVNIPEKRKGVLIGRNASVKNGIETLTKTKINVNDVVEIEGDTINVMKAKDIVKAIGRGFLPKHALSLLDEDYRLMVIAIQEKSKSGVWRIISRIIGKNGITKKKIEEYTDTCLSIYGKTVSIIGKWKNVEKAKCAVEFLVSGKPHAYVYKYLKRIHETL